ncbi:NAD-dependent epimerase/dehydratase family protein [Psychrobacter piechaudii]|uniref:Short chain dehydrogenase n=1 Tax=Psychrobacter piechaudii TaxID=1945521 RepID=A0A1R4GIH3_9GAMM|nr:NAD-dependent epimerase/dehydratase family protein [Psychrobacter piechaudii]SJM67742.1 short chain dehydrogenase [Psychrobacter piechaudii]
MNILVIGASGRVGSELVQQLLEKGHKVTGTSRDDNVYSRMKITLI